MNAQTERFTLAGAAGPLECALDRPAEGLAARGVAVIAHPHPLFGGTMDNKVVQTMVRAFLQMGYRTVRFNFRGVGGSEGQHDNGQGEVDDLLAVVRAEGLGGPLCLAGFSFGAYVTCQAVAALGAAADLRKVVLVGTAASRFSVAPLAPELHERTLVLHGEVDDTVPLSAVMDWARPQHLPVTVVPGVEHFFHGQLPLLKPLTLRHLRS